MASVIVRFTEVGRDKKSWDQEFTTDRDGTLYVGKLMSAVRERKAIMSREVDFGPDGGIYVGGCRRVGSWAIVSQTSTAAD